MFSRILALAAVASLAVVYGQPFPDTPDGEPKAGGDCVISWTPDKTGVWKTTYIELMAGDNYHMEHITTLATVDGTDPTNHSITLPCPTVTPNSAIYFYQFTSPFAPISDTTWSTRFPIANADGSSLTPPANPTQPDGKAIAWGTGALVNPSLAVAAPTDVGSKAAGAAGAANGTTVSGTTNGTTTSGTDAAAGGANTSGTQVATVSTSPSAGVNAGTAKSSPSAVAGTSANVNTKASDTSSAPASKNTNAAMTMSHAPLYALGAVAAVAAFAL